MGTRRLTLAVAAVTFAATAGLLALTAADPEPDSSGRGLAVARTPPGPWASTDDRIARRQASLRAGPRDAGGYSLLAGEYLQKVRETGDAGYYRRAERAVARALALAPGDAGALTERGALRLARHDFRGALQDGLAAHRRAPEVVRPYGVLVDAYVELGRYEQAARVLQRMIDLRPDLAAYSRVSYFRELNGDLAGAMRAMELAVSAGGATPENAAYVSTLLGDLRLAAGRREAAARAFEDALTRFPRSVPARAGLARVSAERGDLRGAIRTLRGVVDRLPLPEYLLELGEAELAAGRRAEGRRDLALVRAEQALLRAGGVDTDAEAAVFEASHGDPRRGVALGRRAWAAAPSVRSADALGWALTRAGRPSEGVRWARRALRLGSRDPLFLLHAGMAAMQAGDRATARRWLRRALADNPRFSPLWAPAARRALKALR